MSSSGQAETIARALNGRRSGAGSERGIRTLILPPAARRVRIFADNDERGQGIAAAREARRRWIAEGREVAVSIAPTVGDDANDIMLKRLKAHG